MKVKTKFLLLDRNKARKDKCTLTLRIGYQRKYIFQETGLEVYPNQFDQKEAEKGQWAVIKKHPQKDQYNIRLKSIQDKVFEVVQELTLKGEPFTIQTIKSRFKRQGHPAIEVFAKILEGDRSIKANTKASISTLITRLGEFSSNIFVSEIDYNFAKSFEKWLLSQPSRTGGTLSVNSTNKYLRDLSRLLTKSIKYEIIDKNKLEGYDYIKEPRGSYNKRAHLTFSDLKRLENIDLAEFLSGQKLDSVNYTKDAFLFACYTGLRISDLMNVCKDHFKSGILTSETQKGNEVVLLPIDTLFEGKALSLLEKYAKHRLKSVPIWGDRSKITHQSNMTLIRSFVFPGMKVSFHSARHTFSTLLIEMGVRPLTVQRLLGHKKLETTIDVYDHHNWSKELEEIRTVCSA